MIYQLERIQNSTFQQSIALRSIKASFYKTFPFLFATIIFAISFGMLCAILEVPLQIVILMNVIISSSAEFIVLVSFENGDTFLAVVIVSILMQLRLFVYSAVVSKYFNWKRWKRPLMSYFISDESLIVTELVSEEHSNYQISSNIVFLTSGFMIWVTWNFFSIIGYLIHNYLQFFNDLSINFIIAASFLGYLLSEWKKYPHRRWLIATLMSIAFFSSLFVSPSWVLLLLITTGMVLGIDIQQSGEEQ